MINRLNKKSLLFKELTEERNKKIFSISDKKFLHNIDSLYYSIKLKNNWKEDINALIFKEYLQKYKEKVHDSFQSEILFQEDEFCYLGVDFICNGISSAPYNWDIEKRDKYIIFLMNNQPNINTPQLWVQIRSQFLWLEGEHKAVLSSLNDIEMILNTFGLEIEEVKENRIDFAYHTNYIQNLSKFFQEENLNKMQDSQFSRASKEYGIYGKYEVDCDYITFGRKKSNNVFFRVYNKTKEVIETVFSSAMEIRENDKLFLFLLFGKSIFTSILEVS